MGLLTMQTVQGRDLRDARQMLESELGDWGPSRLTRGMAEIVQNTNSVVDFHTYVLHLVN